ncbi:MAG TPA: ABC transporter permease [Vicinamibacterales bacterium]|nr:ABC transporter permease [Vicinamibacterales bacterium]
MTDLLRTAARRCIPADWRESVMADLEDEATRRGWGETRLALQLASLGIRMRFATALDAVACDVRFALRSLLATRWFAAGAVLTFALGIGVNVAVFSAVDRLLFRPLPYAEPERLVLLRECALRTGECSSASFPSAVAFSLQSRSATIADIAVAGFSRPYTRDREGGVTQDERFQLVGISARTLRVLGVRPLLGRDISDTEIRERTPVALISHETWRARFASDQGIIGRVLWSGRSPTTIIGVLPPGFIIPAFSSQVSDWAGLVFDHSGDLWAGLPPTGRTMNPVARLRPASSVEAAQAELDALAASSLTPGGTSNPAATPTRLRVLPLERESFATVRPYAWIVVATAWLVLLIACVNLANLFLARGRSREHFAAVAHALGASSIRLVTTSIAESLLVCITGAALAWVALTATERLLSALLPPLFSRYAAGFTDLRVLGFAVLVTFATAFLSGFVPGLRLARVGILGILQRGNGRESHDQRPGARSLLAAEGALGAILVLGAALTGRSFIALTADDLGLQPQGLYGISIMGSRLQASTNGLTVDQTLEALRQLPGTEMVAAADWSPVGTTGAAPFFGVAVNGGRVGLAQVSRDFFATLRNGFIAGRSFTAEEQAGRADVVILNRAAARLLWPDRDPVTVTGEIWRLDTMPARRIVGITADTKTTYGELEPGAMAFLPLGAQPSPLTSVLVRLHSGRQLRVADVQAALRTSAGVTTFRLNYVPESMDFALRDPRFRAVLLTVLAAAGLALAAAGLFAVVSYTAATRTYEMGVRLALGAVPNRLWRLMLRDACMPVVAGMVIGLTAAWWMSSLAQDLLFRTNARDPIHYVIVAAVLVATTVLAAWIPASRAARVNPLMLLRAQ